MFPVPSHLPRSHADHLSSTEGVEQPNPALDLLDPLVQAGPSHPSLQQVQAVRTQLEQAITSNKVERPDERWFPADRQKRGHDLLVDNFPTVSSHIRLGTELRGDFDKLQGALEGLEREIDPSDSEVCTVTVRLDISLYQVSFLPPVLDLLEKHFNAVQSKARAEANVHALKALARYTERLQKLEDAIWAGRGADDWVVAELAGEKGYELEQGLEYLQETRAFKLANVSRTMTREPYSTEHPGPTATVPIDDCRADHRRVCQSHRFERF